MSDSSLTIKVGGRVVAPHYQPVNLKGPSNDDLANDVRLKAFMSTHIPLETESELVKRERVLTGLKNMVLKWVKDTCYKKEYPPAVAEAAGGKLYTSGSYRLGIHEPGADIDTVCVTPSVCDKEDFFTDLKDQVRRTSEIETSERFERGLNEGVERGLNEG